MAKGHSEKESESSSGGQRERADTGSDDVEGADDSGAGSKPAVGLLVSEQCQHLIREFLSYKESEVGTSGAMDHALDATRYVIHTTEMSSNEERRERPEHHGVRSLG